MLIPISTCYKTTETGYILRMSDAMALVLTDRWHGIDFLERLGAATHERFMALRCLICRGVRLPAGTLAFELATHAPLAEWPKIQPGDPLLMKYALTRWNDSR